MSEYWKSNPRKFCDYCKCWTADNKASVEFHERGKRHKENVAKRLDEIAKKGKQDYETQLKEGDYMQEMEAAALRAYKKDIESNPDLTGVKISEIAEASNAKIVVSDKTGQTKTAPAGPKDAPTGPPPIDKPLKMWLEAKNPEGFSYYWNSKTGESVWEAPKEGFSSLEDQGKSHSSNSSPTNVVLQSKSPAGGANKNHQNKLLYGPTQKSQPYSSWQSATRSEETAVDLELPVLPEAEFSAPEVDFRRPKVKFEEKVAPLQKSFSSGPVAFKKRKGIDQHKKNVRRRADE